MCIWETSWPLSWGHFALSKTNRGPHWCYILKELLWSLRHPTPRRKKVRPEPALPDTVSGESGSSSESGACATLCRKNPEPAPSLETFFIFPLPLRRPHAPSCTLSTRRRPCITATRVSTMRARKSPGKPGTPHKPTCNRQARAENLGLAKKRGAPTK